MLRGKHDHRRLSFKKTFSLVRDQCYLHDSRGGDLWPCSWCALIHLIALLEVWYEWTRGYFSGDRPLYLLCLSFPNKGSKKVFTVSKVQVEKFFVHYRLLQSIHSHQGKDFKNVWGEEITSYFLQPSRRPKTIIYIYNYLHYASYYCIRRFWSVLLFIKKPHRKLKSTYIFVVHYSTTDTNFKKTYVNRSCPYRLKTFDQKGK